MTIYYTGRLLVAFVGSKANNVTSHASSRIDIILVSSASLGAAVNFKCFSFVATMIMLFCTVALK